MNNTYDKKTVIITGSSRGIGASTALYFAEKGFNIVINYVSNKEAADNLFSNSVILYCKWASGNPATHTNPKTPKKKHIQKYFVDE